MSGALEPAITCYEAKVSVEYTRVQYRSEHKTGFAGEVGREAGPRLGGGRGHEISGKEARLS